MGESPQLRFSMFFSASHLSINKWFKTLNSLTTQFYWKDKKARISSLSTLQNRTSEKHNSLQSATGVEGGASHSPLQWPNLIAQHGEQSGVRHLAAANENLPEHSTNILKTGYSIFSVHLSWWTVLWPPTHVISLFRVIQVKSSVTIGSYLPFYSITIPVTVLNVCEMFCGESSLCFMVKSWNTKLVRSDMRGAEGLLWMYWLICF